MPIRVIFINYGLFNSNSGGHIAHFANRVAGAGHVAAICADGDPDSVRGILDPRVFAFPHETIDLDPQSVLACGDGSTDVDHTILHVWTPREKVVQLTEALRSAGANAYFVHLEDNEEVLAAANLGVSVAQLAALAPHQLPEPYPLSLSHPRRYQKFLAGSAGVTVIVPTLGKFVSPATPLHVLEPGVDEQLVNDELPPERAVSLREELGIAPDETVCVYNGNMHRANQREIFSLYTAFLILSRRGRRARLIRTGRDFTDGLDLSYAELKNQNVVDLGFLDYERLYEVLKLADFFVQPGASNVFNDYRFPSKVPEFLALGRPVILPATNIGLRMRDGEDALLLRRGDGSEIADQIERLLDDPKLAKKLGVNGRLFAIKELNWERNCEKLLKFYDQSLERHSINRPSVSSIFEQKSEDSNAVPASVRNSARRWAADREFEGSGEPPCVPTPSSVAL